MDIYIYIIVGMSTSFLLCTSLLLFYIRYRKGLLQQQYQMKEAEIRYQKDLLDTMIASQEQERHRIGRDLHDHVGATLAALRMMTEMPVDPITIPRRDGQIRQQIDGIIDSVRNISHDLSPRISGTHGFADAIGDLFDTLNSSGQLQVVYTFVPVAAETSLQEDLALAVYRVIGELVTNTIRHAKADHIDLQLRDCGPEYIIDYRDNGIGLTATQLQTARGMGFRNIESRLNMIGARFHFPPCDQGFYCQINIPLQAVI
jgi:signal transduction histidine kinase